MKTAGIYMRVVCSCIILAGFGEEILAQPDIQTVLAQASGVALELSRSAVTASESRCALTKSECDRQHFSGCRSRMPDGVCTSNAQTPTECLSSSCGSVQDFSHPVGELHPHPA